MHQLHSALSRGFAVRSINDMESANLDPVLFGDFVDPGRRSNEDWPDNSELRRFDGTSQRTFIAWMHDDGLGWGDLLCPPYQVLVFGFRWIGRWAYSFKRADFTFAFSWHAGTMSFLNRAKMLSIWSL